MQSGDEAAKYASKGVDLGDGLLDTARLMVAVSYTHLTLPTSDLV